MTDRVEGIFRGIERLLSHRYGRSVAQISRTAFDPQATAVNLAERECKQALLRPLCPRRGHEVHGTENAVGCLSMSHCHVITLTFFFSVISACLQAQAETPDYSKIDTWLCHPDNPEDACDRDLSTTIIAANGRFTRESWPNNPEPAIDCFYAYPTTSHDKSGNSDLIPAEQGELITAHLQAARFRSQCRVFAPLYRQVTVPALRAMMRGESIGGDRTMALNDIKVAWNYYLEHENQGRGFVLIGHSQGASLLRDLIASEIDGKSNQKQLVSAIIVGTSVNVPPGHEVGGTYKHISLCRSAEQIGCIVTFSSYRDRLPPTADAYFGRISGDSMPGCTNPAALAGGKGELISYFSTIGEISLRFGEYRHWTTPTQPVETPFVSVPGMISAECVRNDGFSYLQISVAADSNDARADDIVGDYWVEDEIVSAFGLHLIDTHLTMGNLVEIVGVQARIYAAQ